MRNIIISILTITLLSNNLYCQKNNINIKIYYFKELNEVDLNSIKELKNTLNGRSKKPKYTFTIKNIYTETETKFEKDNDLFYLPKDIVNSKYDEIQEISAIVNNSNASNKYGYSTELKPAISINNTYNNVYDLVKKIKKVKSGSIDVYWFNGLLPNKYSPENIKKIHKSYKDKGTSNELKTNIIIPTNYSRIVPSDRYYRLKFEGIDAFNKYQITINFYDVDEKKYKEIFNKVLDISEKDNNEDYFLEKEEGAENVYTLNIRTKYIADECYKLFDVLKTDTVPEPDECDECKYLCLYNKEFNIKIRGYYKGISISDLWSEKIDPFFFQCPKN